MRKSLSLLTAAAVVSTASVAQAADYAIDPTHTRHTPDKHLQSANSLDAATHPKARFVSTRFHQFNGDKVSAVEGKLTLLGKNQPVTLKANQFNCFEIPRLKSEVCGGDFEATIDRTVVCVNSGAAAASWRLNCPRRRGGGVGDQPLRFSARCAASSASSRLVR